MEQEVYENLKRAHRPKDGKKKMKNQGGFDKFDRKAEQKDQILEKRGIVYTNPSNLQNQVGLTQVKPEFYTQPPLNNDFQQIKAFYSPQMLENPWASFQK